MDLLAPELRRSITPGYGGIAAEELIITGKKRKREDKPKVVAAPQPQTRAEKRANKSKERKLARLEVSSVMNALV